MEPPVRLLDEVRLLLHAAVRFVDELHADLAVSAPERAVLEYLSRHGPTTVPDIARARGVSRQHIQTIVNELLARSYVEAVRNPAHRRSPLVRLTGDGAEVIEGMLDREGRAMAERLAGIEPSAMVAAADLLADVRARL